MHTKTCFHYHKPGDVAGLEHTLNAMSSAGWEPVGFGRLIQRYRTSSMGRRVYRLGCCSAPKGAPEEAAYLAAQTRAGWSPVCRRGRWLLFSKAAEAAAEDEMLAQGREPVKALLSARIARLESLRRWMLLLAALLLIGGYAVSLRPVLTASVLPLGTALFATCEIKWLEEGKDK